MMTDKQKAEHARLLEGWAKRTLTKAQILLCMSYDRMAERDALAVKMAERKEFK